MMGASIDPKLEGKLNALEERFQQLSQALTEPELTSDLDRYRSVNRSYAELQPIIDKFASQMVGVEEMVSKEMASGETKADWSADKSWLTIRWSPAESAANALSGY